MTSIPVFDQDLFADDFIRAPYPGYAAMRDLDAVVWLPTLGNYALTRHAEIDPDGDAFTLIARRSGKTLQVPANTTILNALTDAGIAVETSCENGVCGSCLTNVLKGTPEHRDIVQTDSEKSSNRQIAVCCSRSQSSTLVLDI